MKAGGRPRSQLHACTKHPARSTPSMTCGGHSFEVGQLNTVSAHSIFARLRANSAKTCRLGLHVQF